jgi:hypothetical protein
MEQNAELRLPTIAVQVKLALVGAGAVDAEVFVADSVRGGRAQLLDELVAMLDGDAAFVPVRQGETVRLLAKRAVAWTSVSRRAEPEAGDAELEDDAPSDVITLYDRRYPVEIELVGGERFAGSLFDSSPADRPRVVDHLNRARHFIRLWTATDQVLINTRRILAVEEK